MEVGQIQFIIAWVTILGAVFAAFGFLRREMRDGFKRQDKRMDRQDDEIKELRSDVTDLQVSVARIEGHLGIGFPAPGQRAEDESPERAA
ncbi:MAG: hypothetical protein OXG47_01940 [bacterium]|nr:hypothetical protein [bacterium]